jgi:voltage-gated potassium channel Kch
LFACGLKDLETTRPSAGSSSSIAGKPLDEDDGAEDAFGTAFVSIPRDVASELLPASVSVLLRGVDVDLAARELDARFGAGVTLSPGRSDDIQAHSELRPRRRSSGEAKE